MFATSVRSGLGVLMLATTTTMTMAAGSLKVDKLRCEYKTDPDRHRRRTAASELGVGAVASVATRPEAKRLSDSGGQFDGRTRRGPGRSLGQRQGGFRPVGQRRVRRQGTRFGPGLFLEGASVGPGRAGIRRGAPSAAGPWGCSDPEDWQAQWIGFDGRRGVGGRASEIAARPADLSGQLLDLDGRRAGWQSAGGSGVFSQGDRDSRGPQGDAGHLPDRRRRRFHAVHQRPRLRERQQLEDARRPGRHGPAATGHATALGIQVTNGGTAPSPAGLMGKLMVLFESGEPAGGPDRRRVAEQPHAGRALEMGRFRRRRVDRVQRDRRARRCSLGANSN